MSRSTIGRNSLGMRGSSNGSLKSLTDTLLTASDVVFTSLGTTLPVIDRPMLAAAVAGRPDGAPLLVIDLGMPRNVEPSAADLDGLTLLDMDVLRAAVEDALSGRQDEVAGANQIVSDEVERYRVASRARDAARHPDGDIEEYRALLAALDDARRAAHAAQASRLDKLRPGDRAHA